MRPELLQRAARLLWCPVCHGAGLHASALGLSCEACGHRVPARDGWLDFLDGDPPPSPSVSERFFQSRAGARLWSIFRASPGGWLLSRRSFRQELGFLGERLALRHDATVADVACGSGHFILGLAPSTSDGLVFGIDTSEAMLAIARDRLRRAGLHHVLLLRANALDLPLAPGAVEAVLCCGGLNVYSDRLRAVAEMRRILPTGGRFAGFALTEGSAPWRRLAEQGTRWLAGIAPISLAALEHELEASGFGDWRAECPAVVGYFSARAIDLA